MSIVFDSGSLLFGEIALLPCGGIVGKRAGLGTSGCGGNSGVGGTEGVRVGFGGCWIGCGWREEVGS